MRRRVNEKMKYLDDLVKTEKYKKVIKWLSFYWIFGVILYSSTIINMLPNPDAIWNGMYYKDSFEWEMGLGRWGIRLFQYVRGGVINSPFITIMSLVYLAVIAYLITYIFEIRTILGKIVVGMLIICSPNIVSVLTYYYCSDMYIFSYLLVVVSVWLMTKAEWNIRGIWYVGASSLCLILSVGIYQAYVGLAILLCAIYLLIMLLRNTNFEDVVRKAIIMITSGAGGIIAYLLITKLLQFITHIEAVENRGFSTMGKVSIAELVRGVANAYRYFLEYYLSDTLINNNWGNRRECNILFFIVLSIVIVYSIIKIKTNYLCRAVAVTIGILMPVCFMSIFILAPQVAITEATGILMVPGMNYIYVLLLLLLEMLIASEQIRKIGICASYVVIALILNMLIVLNLSSQTYMQYNMQKTYYVATEIVRKIGQLDITSNEYEVCILGSMEKGNYPDRQSELQKSVQWITASHGMIWTDDNGRNSCWRQYIEQFLGYSYDSCSREKIGLLKDRKEVQEMSIFPNDKSVMLIDNVIVVKLSEF